jgi:hypothetical protein
MPGKLAVERAWYYSLQCRRVGWLGRWLGKVVQTQCCVVQSSGARLGGELFVRLSVWGLSRSGLGGRRAGGLVVRFVSFRFVSSGENLPLSFFPSLSPSTRLSQLQLLSYCRIYSSGMQYMYRTVQGHIALSARLVEAQHG